jgi:8-amino-7-oxononanoate synthase
MEKFQQFLQSKLTQVAEKGTLRQLRTASPFLEDFVSNDYLGLARSQELFNSIESRMAELGQFQNGSTGSRLLSGNSEYIESVEQKLAAIFQAESAIIFNSGYGANLAVLSSVPQKGDTILYDELSHASIKDGARLSLASRFSFRHNDVNDLEKKLSRTSHGRVFVVIESIYSMDGDESSLREIVSVAEKYDAVIILDEAHSTGLFGDLGEGLAVKKNLHNKIDIRIYTFGKAMGIHGACVVGTKTLREFLINFARPLIYTTAMPIHSIAAIESAFDFLSQHRQVQEVLTQKVNTYLSNLHITRLIKSNSAIQTVVIPGNDHVRKAALHLQSHGFDVRPIVSPTVPVGKERLRICLHTFNSDQQVVNLTNVLNSMLIPAEVE